MLAPQWFDLANQKYKDNEGDFTIFDPVSEAESRKCGTPASDGGVGPVYCYGAGAAARYLSAWRTFISNWPTILRARLSMGRNYN